MDHLTAGKRYASNVVRHPALVTAFIFGVTGLFCVGLSHLKIEIDPDRQLPQTHPYVLAFHEIRHIFGDNNYLTIGLRPTSGNILDRAFLSLVRDITRLIGELPGANPTLLHSIASQATRDIINTDEGLRVEPLLTELPDSPMATETLRARLFSDPRFAGSIVSYDGSTLAIQASFDLTPQLPGYVNIHDAVVAVLQQETQGRAEVLLSGPIVIVAALSIYAGQAIYFLPLTILVIGIIHYDAFRTWQAVVFPVLTGVLAVLWALGLMGFLRVPLDPFNATTPILILAVAAGHAVQILKRYYEEYARIGDSAAAVIESTARIAPVMVAAGLIACLSFLSLATLGTTSMRVFGVFTAFGILSTIAIELTLIPAVRSILSPPTRHSTTTDARVHPRLTHFLRLLSRKLSSRHFARRVVVFCLAILALCGLASRRITVDSSFKRNFSAADPVRTQDEDLNRLFSGTNFILLTIDGQDTDALATPEAVRGISELQARIELLPAVGQSLSIVDTLKSLHRALNSGTSSGELPQTRDLILQYLFLYGLSGGNDLSTQLTPDNRVAKVVVFVRDDSTAHGEELISAIRKLCAQTLPPGYSVRVAGTLASNSALTETLVWGKLLNILQICLISVVVASFVFRNVGAGMLVAVPLAIAVVVNFGVMGMVRMDLDVTSAPISVMAVGIGADYAVYFLFRVREEFEKDGDYAASLERCYATSGKAILFVSSAVGLGYAVLCLSRFRLFSQLGGLVGLSMITSSIATLLILPALLTLISETDRGRRILGFDPQTFGARPY